MRKNLKITWASKQVHLCLVVVLIGRWDLCFLSYLIIVCCHIKFINFKGKTFAGGGTDLERGYGDIRPWRPPFHASPAVRKGPISSKRVSSQDPLLRKFGNFSLNSLNFPSNFSSQAPKFGNFQFTSLQIWKFSVHKPPFSEANSSSQAPHFRNPGRTPLPEKKLSAPRDICLHRTHKENHTCCFPKGLSFSLEEGGPNILGVHKFLERKIGEL